MKNTFICPKCNSSTVILLPGSYMAQSSIVFLNNLGKMALADRYICSDCGFTEEWMQLDDKFSQWVEKQDAEGNTKSDFV
jgi:ribosomal protein S27AE